GVSRVQPRSRCALVLFALWVRGVGLGHGPPIPVGGFGFPALVRGDANRLDDCTKSERARSSALPVGESPNCRLVCRRAWEWDSRASWARSPGRARLPLCRSLRPRLRAESAALARVLRSGPISARSVRRRLRLPRVALNLPCSCFAP